MQIRAFLKRFAAAEDGAITVDWVVLTGAIVGLGIAIVGLVRPSTVALADDIGAGIGGMTVDTTGNGGSAAASSTTSSSQPHRD